MIHHQTNIQARVLPANGNTGILRLIERKIQTNGSSIIGIDIDVAHALGKVLG